MFLHLSVSHSVHRGSLSPPCRHPHPPEMATEAGGTHPTGMHSCNRYAHSWQYWLKQRIAKINSAKLPSMGIVHCTFHFDALLSVLTCQVLV